MVQFCSQADLLFAKGFLVMFALLISRARVLRSAVFCLVVTLGSQVLAQTPEPFDLPIEKLTIVADGENTSSPLKLPPMI